MGRLIPLGFRPVWLSRPIARNENRLTPLTRERRSNWKPSPYKGCGHTADDQADRVSGLPVHPRITCRLCGRQGDGLMSNAMESIVDGYVRMKNRTVLEEMQMHRHRLKVNLFLQGEEQRYNVRPAIRFLDDDLSVIEAGIERL